MRVGWLIYWICLCLHTQHVLLGGCHCVDGEEGEGLLPSHSVSHELHLVMSGGFMQNSCCPAVLFDTAR